MYVAPSTNIKLLKNVPLDKSYEHTIYFSSESAQQSYFSGLAKHSLTAQSYQRVNKGTMRVGLSADACYDCNYLMFQNSGFGNKWFYAFITAVEYVNNAVTEISFEIDVMQTWFFDYSLGKCFIEREHSATDKIGENLVPESVNVGDYVYGNQMSSDLTLNYVVQTTCDPYTYEDILGSAYTMLGKKIVSGTYSFETDADSLMNYLRGVGLDGNHSEFIKDHQTKVANSTVAINIAPTTIKKLITHTGPMISGYAPRNKKLLQYPYTFIYVTNNQGGSAAYKFEYFLVDSQPSFYVCGDKSGGSPAILYPSNYKNVGENTDEALTMSGFPAISFSSNYYDQWLARTQTQTLPNLLNGMVMSAATGALTGNLGGAVVGAGLSTLGSIANLMNEGEAAKLQGSHTSGQTSGVISYWLGLLNFTVATKCITPQIARSIDDYFDKFGYATHRVKTPNRNVRPHWTFTKTVACTIKGSVPADDANKICSIYNNGVTFWKNGAEVGNYSLDNSV